MCDLQIFKFELKNVSNGYFTEYKIPRWHVEIQTKRYCGLEWIDQLIVIVSD